jgi:hypothetical protein
MCAVLSSTVTRADTTLILDACVKKCDPHDDLNRVMGIRAVIELELGRPDLIVSSEDVLKRLGSRAPLSAVRDRGLTATTLTDHLKAGIKFFVDGDYPKADTALMVAIDEADANPGTVVANATLRPLIYRARVGRAVGLARQANKETGDAKNQLLAEAYNTLGDLVRSTPEQSIIDTSGTEANNLFQSERKNLIARGHGSLVIQVNDPSVTFYINDLSDPHTTLFSGVMLPGTYRVFAQDNKGRARRYVIEVTPNNRATLDIDWSLDTSWEATTARETQQPHAGFVHPSEADRAKEPQYVRQIGSLAKVSTIIVVGTIKWGKGPKLFGVAYDASTGTVMRAGIAPVPGDTREEYRQLATSLLSPSRPTPLVYRMTKAPWEVPPPAPPATSYGTSEALHLLGYGLCAAGLVDFGIGAYVGHTGDGESRQVYLAAGGITLVTGLAMILMFRQWGSPTRPSKPSSTVMITPVESGVVAGLSLSF